MRSILAGLALAMAVGFGGAKAADTYTIDPAHADVAFLIQHLGFSKTLGRFNKVSGVIVLDETAPQNSSVSVIIQTASIDTNHEKRDEHLRSGDFLNVETHPTIIFSSSRIEQIGARTARVMGELTMMGITKPVTLFMTLNAVKPHPIPQYNSVIVAGFSGRTTIKRSDYGMSYGLPAIADEIEIILEIEAHKT